jgi:hypothetical protein
MRRRCLLNERLMVMIERSPLVQRLPDVDAAGKP